MMPIKHLLEDFSTTSAGQALLQTLTEDALEDQRLAAFEQGYSAGWDDAFSAQAKDQTKVTGDLAENLRGLSFTYHEALGQMLGSVEPVFRSMLSSVLPELIDRTLGANISEQICQMIRDNAAPTVVVSVPPGTSAAVKPMIDRDISMPIECHEDPELASGQASIRVGADEFCLETDRLITAITEILDAYFHEIAKENRHG